MDRRLMEQESGKDGRDNWRRAGELKGYRNG